jgi:hypothetical protein
MFNWNNCIFYKEPFNYIVCDNFLQDYSDDLFPNTKWTEKYLSKRENEVTKGISAIHSLDIIEGKTKDLLESILSQQFFDQVCKLLKIPLLGETTNVRRSNGEYRIAREAMFVENYKTNENILEPHYDSEVTIWTGLLYFVDSQYGTFNIHDSNKDIVKTINVKRNRLILTENSNKSWHSVSQWLENYPRRSIYTTAEFKNFGRDKDRKPIGATETWIK